MTLFIHDPTAAPSNTNNQSRQCSLAIPRHRRCPLIMA
jgi:hypothetical protein